MLDLSYSLASFGQTMFDLNHSLTSRRLSDDVPTYTAIVSVVLMGGLFFFVLFLLSKVMTAVYGHYMKKRIIKALLARRDTGDSFRQENESPVSRRANRALIMRFFM